MVVGMIGSNDCKQRSAAAAAGVQLQCFNLSVTDTSQKHILLCHSIMNEVTPSVCTGCMLSWGIVLREIIVVAKCEAGVGCHVDFTEAEAWMHTLPFVASNSVKPFAVI